MFHMPRTARTLTDRLLSGDVMEYWWCLVLGYGIGHGVATWAYTRSGAVGPRSAARRSTLSPAAALTGEIARPETRALPLEER